MSRSTASVVAEIDGLLARAGLSPGDSPRQGQYGIVVGVSPAELTARITAWYEAVQRLAGPSSNYPDVASRVIEGSGPASSKSYIQLVGILNAMRADYESGYLRTVEEIVHADLFADFLEMALELLSKHYKDAAAVITGSVLEEHLRKLCVASSIVVDRPDGKPQKADTLNADLAKAGVYNKLEQKQVTAWLDLRNKAAHGHYGEYDQQQVAHMHDGVRAFLIRYPA